MLWKDEFVCSADVGTRWRMQITQTHAFQIEKWPKSATIGGLSNLKLVSDQFNKQ